MKGILKKGLAVALSLALGAGVFAVSGCHFFLETPYDSEESYEADIGGNQGGQSETPGGNEGEIEQGQDDKQPEVDQDDEKEPETPETPDKDPEEETPGGEIGGDESEEPEKPEDNKPTRDELLAELDKIYGKTPNYNGDDFIRDEYGEPIVGFKHDEVYETVMERLDKPISDTITAPLKISVYGDYSSVDVLCANYNSNEKTYTIISLCEYKKTGLENPKTLLVVTFPMDIDAAENKFSKLEEQIAQWKPKHIEDERFDYKVSNIDYGDGYIPDGSEYTDKEFLDACVNVIYPNSSVKYRLVLFEQHISLAAGDNLGIQRRIPFTILTLEDNKIYLEKKEIRSSSQFGNWVENVINYEENKSNNHNWVVIYDIQSKTSKVNLDEVVYNKALVDKIADAQMNSSNEISYSPLKN